MPKYFEIEVSLRGTRPRIWRKFLLAKTASFADLDEAIQIAMGWLGDHLWEFRTTRRGELLARIQLADPDWGEERRLDPRKIRLAPVFRTRQRFVYLYDFGDGWEHDVVLRGEVTLKERFRRRLVRGRRACPPDDIGGISGYDAACWLVRTGRRPRRRGDVALSRRISNWSPEAFDYEEIRKAFDR